VARGTIARAAALDILRRIRAGATFDTALSAVTKGIEDHDRRLAHEISAGVLRSRSNLDSQLRPFLSGKWERTAPDLIDLLRIGLYQLKYLDRVPDFAAVQTTVEVAKGVAGKGGAGLVNAVLRRAAAGDPEVVSRTGPVEELGQLAEAYSHPEWLVQRWIDNLGVERTRALLEHNNHKPALVIQPVMWSAEQLREQLTERGIAWSEAPFGAGFAVDHDRVENLPGYADGSFIVQDAAQRKLLVHAQIPDGALVWDTCASPGGKAAMLSLRGPVVASEINAIRMRRLRDTLNRVASSVLVLRADALQPPFASESIAVTLVDAPCSATGTLQRHPDGRWRLSEEKIVEAARVQAELLSSTAVVVHKGGLLVYMTCSLEPEENKELIDSFLEEHSDFAREKDDLFLFPPDSGTDGGYVACLRNVS
jgi:16S rRNA (cytosine967-C5)-methyltransferase